MAIVKHQSHKNSDYTDALTYYTYQHNEVPDTGRYDPILDENGMMIPRENVSVNYITAKGEESDPELWASACVRTNILYGKNRQARDRKNHEYIISHPAEDRAKMTMDDLLNEGRAFAKKYFKGYDVLISVHRDTDNDHIHICINSVRAIEREREPWMMQNQFGEVLDCEMKAGGKHQDSPGLRIDMNEWLLNYSMEHGYVLEDNNKKASENRQKVHGKKNKQMREALLDAAKRSQDMRSLRTILKKEYGIELSVSSTGKTVSVRHPDTEKAVRLKTLDLEITDLTGLFTGSKYTYTKADEDRQIQKEIEAEEAKKYIEWVHDRRQRNNDRMATATLLVENLLAEEAKERGETYNRSDFGDLLYLINQTYYLGSDLNIERQKAARLLERWDQYRNQGLSDQERRKHAGYVSWCGCDPDSEFEYDGLKAEIEVIDTQFSAVVALNNALRETREQWKGHNELEHKIERAEKEVDYAKDRKRQLKNRLKDVRASRKKMWEIYQNCRHAAARRGINNEYWDKARYFEGLWREKIHQEIEIWKQIREVNKRKKEAKEFKRDVERISKEIAPQKKPGKYDRQAGEGDVR